MERIDSLFERGVPYGIALLRVSLGVMLVAHSVLLKYFVFTLPGTAQFFVSIGLPVGVLKLFGAPFSQGTVRIMTWGGLRGGISVALALSLPAGPEREILLTVCYIVVLFSILVQGTTMERVVARIALQEQAAV